MTIENAQTLERMLALRALPTFEGLDERGMAAVARQCSERIVETDEVILSEGAAMDRTFVVVDGRVRVEVGGEVVARSERRIGVGILGMLAGYDSERAVVADTRSRLLVVERSRLQGLMAEDFSILAHVLRVLAREIIDTYVKLDRDYTAPLESRPVPAHLSVTDRDLHLVERAMAVREVPAFGRSSLDSVMRYAKLMTQRTVGPGEVLWREGDPSSTYVHIVRGGLSCSREGSHAVLRYRAPTMPGLFGVLSGREACWYTATAESETCVLEVDREVIFDLLEDDFDMAVLCLTQAARRLIRFLEMRDEGRETDTVERD